MRRLIAVTFCSAVLLVTSCIAPLARTSEIRKGWSVEAGAGITEYRGHTIDRDSSSWWGGRTRLADVNAGLFGMARVSYATSPMYGFDLTLAGAWGVPVQAGKSMGGWLDIAVGAKARPFRSNNLFFAELGPPSLAIGWVGGFPMQGREQWSVTARVASAIPEYLPEQLTLDYLEELWPPNSLQLNVGRNITTRAGRRKLRITPNVGVAVGLDWTPFRPSISNIVAGVNLSP